MGAGLVAAVRKVLIVDFAVATDAKRYSVGDLKSQFLIVCPMLNMVGMNGSLRTTYLTRIIIALIDRLTPSGQLWGQTSALSIHRLSVLPGIASCALAGTRARAEDLISLVGGEGTTTNRTYLFGRRIAFSPTILGAIVRLAIRSRFKFFSANTADVGSSTASCLAPVWRKTFIRTILPAPCLWGKRFAAMLAYFGCPFFYAHAGMIAYFPGIRKYCAVTLQRMRDAFPDIEITLVKQGGQSVEPPTGS
jgi:hypothetical protein